MGIPAFWLEEGLSAEYLRQWALPNFLRQELAHCFGLGPTAGFPASRRLRTSATMIMTGTEPRCGGPFRPWRTGVIRLPRMTGSAHRCCARAEDGPRPSGRWPASSNLGANPCPMRTCMPSGEPRTACGIRSERFPNARGEFLIGGTSARRIHPLGAPDSRLLAAPAPDPGRRGNRREGRRSRASGPR